MVTDADIECVLSLIDKEELAELTLSLASIYSPPEEEGKAAEAVAEWLRREGFETKLIGLTPERPNVVGTLKGTGGGYSLIFCSHLDVAPALPELLRDPMARGMERRTYIIRRRSSEL